VNQATRACFEIDARVDESQIHVSGRVPFLFARLFAGPLALGLKRLTERALEDRPPETTPGRGQEP
jgi:hypothetical protein